jgi:hypothetical protein
MLRHFSIPSQSTSVVLYCVYTCLGTIESQAGGDSDTLVRQDSMQTGRGCRALGYDTQVCFRLIPIWRLIASLTAAPGLSTLTRWTPAGPRLNPE